MAGWGNGMVDMGRTTEEKISAIEESMPMPVAAAEYPWGLNLTLTEKELEKLGLSDECSVGDTLHFVAVACVKSVSKNEYNGAQSCSVNLQIEKMAVESEDEENEIMMAAAKRYRRSKG